MLSDIKNRLEGLGFSVADTDEWALQFCLDKTENYIKINCNLNEVPSGLREVAVDLVCGEFLSTKFNAGQLEYETAVKNIKMGDVSVDFGNVSDADLIKALINDLKGQKVNFSAYRVIQW